MFYIWDIETMLYVLLEEPLATTTHEIPDFTSL